MQKKLLYVIAILLLIVGSFVGGAYYGKNQQASADSNITAVTTTTTATITKDQAFGSEYAKDALKEILTQNASTYKVSVVENPFSNDTITVFSNENYGSKTKSINFAADSKYRIKIWARKACGQGVKLSDVTEKIITVGSGTGTEPPPGGGPPPGGTKCVAPPTPKNLKPADKSTIKAGERTIKWSKVKGAGRYYVTIDRDPFASDKKLNCPQGKPGWKKLPRHGQVPNIHGIS